MAAGEVEGGRELIKMGGTLSLSSRELQTITWGKVSTSGRFLWGFSTFSTRGFGSAPAEFRGFAPEGYKVNQDLMWVRDAMTSFNIKATF